jgi:hypothetical protein
MYNRRMDNPYNNLHTLGLVRSRTSAESDGTCTCSYAADVEGTWYSRGVVTDWTYIHTFKENAKKNHT